MSRIRWYGPAVVLLITILLVALGGPRLVRSMVYAQQEARIIQAKDSLQNNLALRELSDSFRQIGEAVRPSVVSIEIFSKTRPRAHRGIIPDELRRFLPRPFIPDQEEEDAEKDDQDNRRFDQPRRTGNGSGWVYDRQGHIITNYHVVRDAEEIRVRFTDDEERTAKVVGFDPDTDIAVIKVDGDGFHPAAIADHSVEQGDLVFAFGSPYNFKFSMSMGIVSATDRQLNIIRDDQGFAGYEKFIQTDAAINPGNSGGPLTNTAGQVVGMNSAIATRTGGYEGLGFAIPISTIKNVVEQLITHGKVRRGFLGINLPMFELDAKRASTFGFQGKGILVSDVIPGYPAEKAGIKRDDIITKINGKPVRATNELRNLVASLPPGTEIELEIFRQGKTLNFKVEIAELPVDKSSLVKGGPTPEQAETASNVLQKVGITGVRTMTKDLAEKYDMDFNPGVLVTRVRPDSAAAVADLRPGYIITEVQGVEIKNLEDLSSELEKHADKDVIRMSVNDDRGQSRYVFLDIPKD